MADTPTMAPALTRARDEQGRSYVATDPSVRFAAAYRESESGCWEWQHSLDRKGYGRFRARDGRSCMAHRWAYSTMRHPIPATLVLDHLCRNPRCVNPWHLEAVSSRTNTLRGVGTVAAINSGKRLCPRGHLLSRTVEQGMARRRCKECQRAAVRDCMRRRRARSTPSTRASNG